MALFDLSKYNIPQGVQLARDLSEVIYQTTVEYGDLQDYHEIVTGVNHNQEIPFIGPMGPIGKKIEHCAIPEASDPISVTAKQWNPALVGGRIAFCHTETDGKMLFFTNPRRINPDFFADLGSQEIQLITKLVSKSVNEMLFRLSDFGDKAAATRKDGGNISDGADVSLINPIDGLWKQLETEIPATSEYYVPIAKNTEQTFDKQRELPDDFAWNLFEKMLERADPRLLQNLSGAAFHVTAGIYQNYTKYLRAASKNFQLDTLLNGLDAVSFAGIPVIARYDWDQHIKIWLNQGAYYKRPHRALLTPKANMPIATASASDFLQLESFYEPKDKKVYIDAYLKIDSKMLQDYLAIVAY